MTTDKRVNLNKALQLIKGFSPVGLLSPAVLDGPGVYLIRHIQTNKFYIGGTANMNTRIEEHYSKLHCEKHHATELQKDYKNNSIVTFYFRPTDSDVLAFKLEQSLLDEYFGKDFIYNTAPSARGMSGYKHTDEAKEKMRVTRNTPEMKKFMSNLQSGKKISDEQKELISKTQKEFHKNNPLSHEERLRRANSFRGVARTEEAKAKMSAGRLAKSNPVVVAGVRYGSVKEAALATGIGYTTICERMKSPNFHDFYRVVKEPEQTL